MLTVRWSSGIYMSVDHDWMYEHFRHYGHRMSLSFEDLDRHGKKWRKKKIFAFRRYAKRQSRIEGKDVNLG
jgi:hypothetical protein